MVLQLCLVPAPCLPTRLCIQSHLSDTYVPLPVPPRPSPSLPFSRSPPLPVLVPLSPSPHRFRFHVASSKRVRGDTNYPDAPGPVSTLTPPSHPPALPMPPHPTAPALLHRLLHRVPKLELHLHLDGSLPPSFIAARSEARGVPLPSPAQELGLPLSPTPTVVVLQFSFSLSYFAPEFPFSLSYLTPHTNTHSFAALSNSARTPMHQSTRHLRLAPSLQPASYSTHAPLTHPPAVRPTVLPKITPHRRTRTSSRSASAQP